MIHPTLSHLASDISVTHKVVSRGKLKIFMGIMGRELTSDGWGGQSHFGPPDGGF